MIVSIDPGVHAVGWAQFAPRLVACGLVRGDLVELRIALAAPLSGAAVVVVEVPQVYPRAKVDPNDLVDVAVVAGMVLGLAPQSSDVVVVHPSTWKGQRPKDIDARLTRSLLDVDERRLVDDVDVPRSLRHNVVDAVGIGLWRLSRR